MLRAKPWDLLILDIYMPDRSGLDILKQVQASHPKVKILIISGLAGTAVCVERVESRRERIPRERQRR